MCDASYQAAGVVLLTEDYTNTAEGFLKTIALIVFGFRIF